MNRIPIVFACLALLTNPLTGARAADGAPSNVSPALRHARLLNQAFVEAVEKASPSVVVLTVEQKFERSGSRQNRRDSAPEPGEEASPEDFREWWRRQLEDSPLEGRGSGIVIRKDGYILTNAHVVDGADKITVTFKNGRSHEATIAGIDRRSEVAVIKIDGKDFPAARLGDSSKARVGQFAIAIGAPFELDYSATFGHISAVGRSEILSRTELLDQNFIQTDASINPGNSGGPLIDIEGRVVGMNTIIRGIGTGIGFAIPINLARKIAEQLIEKGRYVRSWVGIEITDFSEFPLMQQYSGGVKEGVIVIAIHPLGPAASSELAPGDIVTRVSDQKVRTREELIKAVRSREVGSVAKLDFIRLDGANRPTPMTVNIEPGEYPERIHRRARSRWTGGSAEASANGISIKDLDPDLAAEYRVPLETGVVLTDLRDMIPTDLLGPGDIITKIGGRRITGVQSFKRAARELDFKEGVIINYISDHPLRRDWKRMEILFPREAADDAR